jgi:hypothetical protein
MQSYGSAEPRQCGSVCRKVLPHVCFITDGRMNKAIVSSLLALSSLDGHPTAIVHRTQMKFAIHTPSNLSPHVELLEHIISHLSFVRLTLAWLGVRAAACRRRF